MPSSLRIKLDRIIVVLEDFLYSFNRRKFKGWSIFVWMFPFWGYLERMKEKKKEASAQQVPSRLLLVKGEKKTVFR